MCANVKGDDTWNFRPQLYTYREVFGTLVKAPLPCICLTLKKSRLLVGNHEGDRSDVREAIYKFQFSMQGRCRNKSQF
jgi:hypothetical protein